jgi:murein DD-endopeptidase MepM/ murein hydrolase activator NlpD
MRPPLRIPLKIRSAKGDKPFRGQPGIRDDKLLGSPAGGAFGMVRSGGHKAHQGWDLYAPIYTPVLAIADGKIVAARHYHGYGRGIVLQFDFPGRPNGLYAFYGHLCHALVSPGQIVKEGDTLGYTGNSGNAWGTPPHLHFEIRTIAEPPGSDHTDPTSALLFRINPGTVLGGHYFML